MSILAGRLLAVCVHPQAAWRVLPVSGKLVLATTYFSAAYLTILVALLTL
jgi:hypothetical protein